MSVNRPVTVVDIEVVEDFSDRARCDEGYLRLRRLRCRNRRSDGSTSPVYGVDVVDRPHLDAVAVMVYRRAPTGIEVLIRKNLRPAAYLRRGQQAPIPDPHPPLRLEEIVAGVMEAADRGEEGLRRRAALEVKEEGGFEVAEQEILPLGGPFFVAPGILSEKIFLVAVDVTGKPQSEPSGDGSPLEEGFALEWWPIRALLEACRAGQVQDAKTEIAVTRFLALAG
jgi:ADP-ribose pyrophosphatase